MLNKIHYKNSDNREHINNWKKVIISFSLFTELPKFPGEYPNRGNEDNYKKCKEFYPKENILKSVINKCRKVDNYQQDQEVKQVTDF